MGLSRNKVAVSEGAAGSPPFYGERRQTRKCRVSEEIEKKKYHLTRYRKEKNEEKSGVRKDFVVRFSGCDEKKKPLVVRGCSSVGRAPALQAGGQEFESLHLHQSGKGKR